MLENEGDNSAEPWIWEGCDGNFGTAKSQMQDPAGISRPKMLTTSFTVKTGVNK